MKVTRFAWLLVVAAIVTIALKTAAWLLTGSVGLLSDALESLVNLAAAAFALVMLSIAARPPDELHAYGHGKAEYFASGAEGALIVGSAALIIWSALPRLLSPQPLEQVGLGALIATVAGVFNIFLARVLLRAAHTHNSTVLHASSQHLVADAWTSAAVIAGVVAVQLTGWQRLDPILAIVVAANIVRTGVLLVRDAALGLMDTAIPQSEQHALMQVLDSYGRRGVSYHALRTRRAGVRRFASVHVLVPGAWSVQEGHDLLEVLEDAMRGAVPGINIITHLEPRDDPAALYDIDIDRDSGSHRTARP